MGYTVQLEILGHKLKSKDQGTIPVQVFLHFQASEECGRLLVCTLWKVQRFNHGDREEGEAGIAVELERQMASATKLRPSDRCH